MSAFDQERVPVLSIEQQWKIVDRWRDALILSAAALGPSNQPAHLSADEAEIGVPSQALADLEHAWQAIDKANYWPVFWPLVRESPERIASTPIEALAAYVESGLYPPPELLLVLRTTFESYIGARGEIDLEEAFFGPPKRKAGNYAARRTASYDEGRWALEILSSTRDKTRTDIEVAEEIVAREGLTIDPESLLRRARKRWSRVEKPEK
jgi:hypothetical protein